MEELNNRQIVLLTMLVSFVVSIATGIITVAMLEEAPQTMTQTVNRVVERTIERVVAGTSTPEKSPPITTVTKEVTVYAKEDDLIVSAVEKNQPRVAMIYPRPAGGGTSTSALPIATGFVVSRDGYIATDRASVMQGSELKEDYIVVVKSQTYIARPISLGGTQSPLLFLKISDLGSESIDSVSFGSMAVPRTAQTLIVLGDGESTGIFKTTVAKLRFSEPETPTSTVLFIGIETSPQISEQHRGGLVVNLDGQAEGIVVGVADGATAKYYVYPSSRIFELVGAAPQGNPAQAESTDRQT